MQLHEFHTSGRHIPVHIIRYKQVPGVCEQTEVVPVIATSDISLDYTDNRRLSYLPGIYHTGTY